MSVMLGQGGINRGPRGKFAHKVATLHVSLGFGVVKHLQD